MIELGFTEEMWGLWGENKITQMITILRQCYTAWIGECVWEILGVKREANALSWSPVGGTVFKLAWTYMYKLIETKLLTASPFPPGPPEGPLGPGEP